MDKIITITRSLSCVVVASMFVALHARADSLTLNSGEIINGQIVSETASNLEVEIAGYHGVIKTFDKAAIRPDSIRRSAIVKPKVPTPAPETPPPAATAAAENNNPFTFTGNGFDFIVWLCKERNAQISIDPEIVPELAKFTVEITTPTSTPSLGLVNTQFQSLGVTNIMLQLTPQLKVAFLTKPAAWAYYLAMANLRKGNLPVALQSLNTAPPDTSEFGQHSRDFLATLQKIALRRQQMAVIETEISQSVAAFKSAKERASAAEVVAGSGFNRNRGFSYGVGGEVQRMGGDSAAIARQQYVRAVEQFRNTVLSLDKFYAQVIADNESLVPPLQEAEAANFLGESNFIFEHLVESYERLRGLCDLANKQEIPNLTFPAFGLDMPEAIRERRAQRKRVVETAENNVVAGLASLAINLPRARKAFVESLSLDRSALWAHVTVGYSRVQTHVRALAITFAPAGDVAARRVALEKEFQDQRRNQLWQALVSTNADAVVATRAPSAKIGSTKGLAVIGNEGGLFPLSVRIEAVPYSAPAQREYTRDFWGRILERYEYKITESIPISFGDFGSKDFFTWVSAIKAYEWLKTIDAGLDRGRGLRIEYHELYLGKGGDSAGVTIAISGYSALKSAPVRQDVAMTGSIRADGTVKAVGAVPEKLEGAFLAGGVETVIVPKENQADLLAVPVDQLCRLAFVTGDDIQDYIKYSLLNSTNEWSPDKWEAQKALTRLRIGQVMLLLGESKLAREMFKAVRDEHPEIYNAGRLLEVLGRTPETMTTAFPNMTHDTLEDIVLALNPSPKALSPKPETPKVEAPPPAPTVEAPAPAVEDPWWKRFWWVGALGLLGLVYIFKR